MKFCHVTTSQGDVLDATANNIPFNHRNNVGDTITGIDHSSCNGCVLACAGILLGKQ